MRLATIASKVEALVAVDEPPRNTVEDLMVEAIEELAAMIPVPGPRNDALRITRAFDEMRYVLQQREKP